MTKRTATEKRVAGILLGNTLGAGIDFDAVSGNVRRDMAGISVRRRRG